MELTLLDSDLNAILPVDKFQSLIWTDRYYGYGDFEITKIADSEAISQLVLGRYFRLENSDRIMIIEDFGIKTSNENGNRVIIKGRSLESILKRRVIWSPTILSGNFQNSIQSLLNTNAITPTDSDRDISRLSFEASDDPAITGLTVDEQFMGEYLYDAILSLCLSKNVGFKITLSDSGNFVFKLYAGKDRSYAQLTNPHVVFSPEFDNLVNSDYRESDLLLKTIALVAGEGEGIDRMVIAVSVDEQAGTDLDRREIFVNASDITRNVDGGLLTDNEYIVLLAQRGAEALAENSLVKTFEGEADATTMFKYGDDFEMGDIVQVANEYGHEEQSRVTELIHSQDESGIKVYPTFSAPYN